MAQEMLIVGRPFLSSSGRASMRKLVVPLALAASSFISSSANAQQAAPAPSPVTGNITLASEYRFRGIDQTAGKPAIQGGFDYSHASGVYLGNWNSNISQGAGFPGGNIEMDFYGGSQKTDAASHRSTCALSSPHTRTHPPWLCAPTPPPPHTPTP